MTLTKTNTQWSWNKMNQPDIHSHQNGERARLKGKQNTPKINTTKCVYTQNDRFTKTEDNFWGRGRFRNFSTLDWNTRKKVSATGVYRDVKIFPHRHQLFTVAIPTTWILAIILMSQKLVFRPLLPTFLFEQYQHDEHIRWFHWLYNLKLT